MQLWRMRPGMSITLQPVDRRRLTTLGSRPPGLYQCKLCSTLTSSDKLRDGVGLYLDRPAHATVLSVDEKSQSKARNRTRPALPMKKGRAATMTHDYKRHGTTTLFAALSMLDGTIISRCEQRHRHSEWLTFLRQINRETPKDKELHLICDNYATHKHPNVQA